MENNEITNHESEGKSLGGCGIPEGVKDILGNTDYFLILQEDDPRQKSYDLGIVDISPQVDKGLDKKHESCMGDSRQDYKNLCNDFKFLKIDIDLVYKELELGFYMYRTPKVRDRCSVNLLNWMQELEKNFDKFESEHNLNIQRKKYDYLKKCYIFANALEQVVIQLDNNPNYMIENADKLTDKIVNTIIRYIENDREIEKDKKVLLIDMLHKKGLELLLPDKTKTRILQRNDIEKMNGEKVRWKTQYLISRHNRHIEDGGCEYVEIKNGGTNKIEKSRPHIGGDNKGLYDILKERGYNLTLVGRSGFAARNSYRVSKKEPKTQKIFGPLIIGGGLEPEMKKSLGLDPSGTSGENYIVWTGEIFEGEIILDSEFEEMEQIIDKAREELQKREHAVILEYIESNKQGNIAMIDVGGNERFSSYDIPKRYKVIAQKKIANTQDHRQNISHTYTVILLDIEGLDGKKQLTIKIPDEYKGIVIGKGGENIKRLSEELGCNIKIL